MSTVKLRSSRSNRVSFLLLLYFFHQLDARFLSVHQPTNRPSDRLSFHEQGQGSAVLLPSKMSLSAPSNRRAALLIVEYLTSLTGPDKDARPGQQESLHVACDAIRSAFDLDEGHETPVLNPQGLRLTDLLQLQLLEELDGGSGSGASTPNEGVGSVTNSPPSLTEANENSKGGGAKASSKPPRDRSTTKLDDTGGDLSGRKILLVDDVQSVLKLGVRRLTKAGATVATATDGGQAVDEVRHPQDFFNVLNCVADVFVLFFRRFTCLQRVVAGRSSN